MTTNAELLERFERLVQRRDRDDHEVVAAREAGSLAVGLTLCT